jgi:hypothetical protein
MDLKINKLFEHKLRLNLVLIIKINYLTEEFVNILKLYL